MSWISTNNLRRFADNLFHGKLSFSGNVTHNGAVEFNGGVKVNTVKAEFTAPVSFTGTATYKNNEIATKADIIGGGSSITVDSSLSDTSTNPVQNKVIKEALSNVLNKSSNPTGDNSISWDEENNLVISNPQNPTRGSVLLSPGGIAVHDGIGNLISIFVNSGINTIAAINNEKVIHQLTFDEKLRYGLGGEEKNIATEDYVKSAIAAIASYDDTKF